MVHRLAVWAVGHGPGVEISEEIYQGGREALDRGSMAVSIEEKLEILIENLEEYERDVLGIAVRRAIRPDLREPAFFSDQQLIIRRAVNFLSAARLYRDHVFHVLSRPPMQGAALFAKDQFRKAYDSSQDYRIVEALRNQVQHRAFPVHLVHWIARKEQAGQPEERTRFLVEPKLTVQRLSAEGGFKETVLKELEKAGIEELSVTPLFRAYIDKIAAIHSAIRQIFAIFTESDLQKIASLLELARTTLNSDGTGLVIATSGGRQGEEEPEGDDLVEDKRFVSPRAWLRWRDLVEKNQHLSGLSRRYASAEHIGDSPERT